MAVKVRCKGCQKVLKAPDKARGKSLKCPQCGERVRVPSGEKKTSASKSSAKRSAKKKRPPKVQEEHTDGLGFLAAIDLEDTRRVEDRHMRICPKCAVEVGEEDEVCENCGVIIETGQLSAKEKRKRERRGPDPKEFYPIAWSDPGQFVMKHIKLVIRTIIFWAMFGTLTLSFAFMSNWCDSFPPKMFWAGLSFVALLGIYGWFFALQLEIIKLTFANKKVLKKVKTDPFSAISLGLKLYIWPLVLILPFFWFPPALLVPILVFPIAMVHFAMPYTYKAFLPITMLKQFYKTISASLYWLLIVSTLGILNIILFVLLIVFGGDILGWVFGLIVKTAGLMTTINPDEPSFTAYICIGIAGMLIYGVTSLLIAAFTAPVAIYSMRLTGLFGYYNQEKLELMRFQGEGIKAPFGARYMAFLVDRLIGAIFWLILFGLFSGIAIFFSQADLREIQKEAGDEPVAIEVYVEWFVGLSRVPAILTTLIFLGFVYKYYITSVIGPSQATLGKHALGLIVTDHKGRRLKKNLAWKRFFFRSLLGTFTLGIGHLVAAFNEKQQTIHDKMTKTQVLWKGDDERS